MNTEQKQLIIKECLRLAKGGKPETPTVGLCNQLATKAMIGYSELYPFMQGWKHHSGKMGFPILNYYEHQENNTLWTGEQGKLRRSLARYIAKQLKATL